MLKILAFFILLAIGSETLTSGFYTMQTSVYTEKDQNEAEDAKKEQEDNKDKFSQYNESQENNGTPSANYFLSNDNFTYTAYLSLPELPPEIA